MIEFRFDYADDRANETTENTITEQLDYANMAAAPTTDASETFEQLAARTTLQPLHPQFLQMWHQATVARVSKSMAAQVRGHTIREIPVPTEARLYVAQQDHAKGPAGASASRCCDRSSSLPLRGHAGPEVPWRRSVSRASSATSRELGGHPSVRAAWWEPKRKVQRLLPLSPSREALAQTSRHKPHHEQHLSVSRSSNPPRIT